MAIAYDATSGAARGWVTSDSFSHTCSGDDRLLLAWVFFDRGGGSYTTSGITYGGVALTQYGTWNNGSAYAELWYLANPSSGANTVAATYNNTGPTAKVLIRVLSYTGVSASTPLGTLATAQSAASATATVNATSAVDEMVADYVWVYSGGQNIVAGSGQTSRHEIDNAALGYGAHGWSDEAGAASVTMSWTFSSDAWMIAAVPIKPAGAAAGGVPKTTKQTLMGVG